MRNTYPWILDKEVNNHKPNKLLENAQICLIFRDWVLKFLISH